MSDLAPSFGMQRPETLGFLLDPEKFVAAIERPKRGLCSPAVFDLV
jgi:hypothetical protein